MLKIKDNVDLRTLTYYGFYELDKVYFKVVPICKGSGDARIIKVSKATRKIYSLDGYYGKYMTDNTLKKYIVVLYANSLVEEK